MKDRIALVVHGHFYQPPRENPWTDEVEDDPSAAPFANWNARINAECYRSNAYARIRDGRNRVAATSNNFAHTSFNIGPTLGRWLDREDPGVSRRIRDGNEEQRSRLSGGGALAQLWSHPIAPLLSARDLRTQVRWGIADFHRRYGQAPAGMWLPETAANDSVLAALIDAGMVFTILAPEQIRAVRPPGGAWQEVTSTSLDTGRPYRFFHPDGSGRALSLCVFDGALSRDLAFGNVSRDAETFVAAVERSAARSKAEGTRLVLAASDGELYGHHKKFADLTLAYALNVTAPGRGIGVTNLEAFLATAPAVWEARLRPGENGEGTAWSCSHGLGRWTRDCGCRMNHAKGSSQAWRAPLREALDLLRDGAASFFDSAGRDCFEDPWKVRDDYGEVVDESLEARQEWVVRSARPGASVEATARGLLLLEMQRSLLLMYTSCAWFFDDVAGPESGIALQRAAHAMDLWKRAGGVPPERAFLEPLSRARSNDRRLGSGAEAFVRASAAKVEPEQALARAVFARLLSEGQTSQPVAGFSIAGIGAETRGDAALQGHAEVCELRTGTSLSASFSAASDGAAGLTCDVAGRSIDLDHLSPGMARPLRVAALARLAQRTQSLKEVLDAASPLGKITREERQLLGGGLVRALADCLEAMLGRRHMMNDPEADQALELLQLAGMVGGEDLRRAKDLVGEHLEAFRLRHQVPPKSLYGLAELLDSGGTTHGKTNV